MGGAACAVPHLAIMRPFVSGNKSVVPTDTALLPQFDEKIARACAHPEINKAFEDDEKTDDVCAIMGKPIWSPRDRQTINDLLNALYS
jgi:hypothetical protein